MQKIWEIYVLCKSLYSSLIATIYRKYSLIRTEFDVLMFLANNPQFDTASDIVETRHISKSHVSISVRRLAEQGYLKAEYHDGDRRTIHLSVTDKAHDIIAAGRKAQEEFISILGANFSKEEKEQISTIISRITENVKSYTHNITQ